MLPPDIEAFLLARIESIEGLEIVLLLAGDANGSDTPEAIAESLGIAPALCRRKLQALVDAGLVVGEAGRFRYRPASPELRAQAEATFEVYSRRRLEVINAIVSSSLQRLRELADAFRLRKEKKDG
ncbi:MAG: hypothetical protein U1F43_19750 [Myxococcota bacterium]